MLLSGDARVRREVLRELWAVSELPQLRKASSELQVLDFDAELRRSWNRSSLLRRSRNRSSLRTWVDALSWLHRRA